MFSVTATAIFLKTGSGEGTSIIAFDLELNVCRSCVGLVVGHREDEKRGFFIKDLSAPSDHYRAMGCRMGGGGGILEEMKASR